MRSHRNRVWIEKRRGQRHEFWRTLTFREQASMDTQQRRLVSGNGRRITRGGCPRTMSRTRGSTVSRTTDGAHQIRTQKELLDLASSRSLQTWRRADSVNRGRKNLTRVGSRIEWNWKTASMDGLQGILEPIKFFFSFLWIAYPGKGRRDAGGKGRYGIPPMCQELHMHHLI